MTSNAPAEPKPKIVLDCDPGIDDAFAILCALRWCNLLAITTVAGNVGIDHTTHNALIVTQLAHADVPVHRGAAAPLVGDVLDAAEVHGTLGMGGVASPQLTTTEADDDAVTALLELAAPDVTVVAVGPLTNIALAIRQDPTWIHRIERLVVMGGSTDAGNVNAAAEFNIWADPEAAAEVFLSGVDLTMVGLNLTRQVRMGGPQIDELRATGQPTAVYVADALEYYAAVALREYGVARSAMHDPCAVLYVPRPDLFRAERVHCVVETAGEHTRGMTLVDHRQNAAPPNITALVYANEAPVVDLIMSAAINPRG